MQFLQTFIFTNVQQKLNLLSKWIRHLRDDTFQNYFYHLEISYIIILLPNLPIILIN